MGGSAAVFCGFVAAVTTGVAKGVNLHAVLCIAENSVDERSTRPDDILTSYSGKTVNNSILYRIYVLIMNSAIYIYIYIYRSK